MTGGVLIGRYAAQQQRKGWHEKAFSKSALGQTRWRTVRCCRRRGTLLISLYSTNCTMCKKTQTFQYLKSTTNCQKFMKCRAAAAKVSKSQRRRRGIWHPHLFFDLFWLICASCIFMRCSLLHRGGLFYHPNDNGKEVQYYSLKASMEQSFLLVTRDEQEAEYGSGNGLLSRGFLKT